METEKKTQETKQKKTLKVFDRSFPNIFSVIVGFFSTFHTFHQQIRLFSTKNKKKLVNRLAHGHRKSRVVLVTKVMKLSRLSLATEWVKANPPQKEINF